MEPNTTSDDRIKAYLDDPQGMRTLKTLNRGKSRGEPLKINNNTWNFSSRGGGFERLAKMQASQEATSPISD